jgi:hypothetical protein
LADGLIDTVDGMGNDESGRISQKKQEEDFQPPRIVDGAADNGSICTTESILENSVVLKITILFLGRS